MNAETIWPLCRETALLFHGHNQAYAHRAACLLLGTAAQESAFRHRRQLGFKRHTDGGAFGLWQCERTAIKNGLDWLDQHPEKPRIQDWLAARGVHTCLAKTCEAKVRLMMQDPEGDPLACLIARAYYMECPGLIPDSLGGQAEYWKRWYNTYAGKGTVGQYRDSWFRLGCDAVVGAG